MTLIRTLSQLLPILLLLCLLDGVLHAIPIRVLAWDHQVAAMKLAIRDAKGSSPIEEMHPAGRTKIYQVAVGEIPLVIESLDRKGPDGKPCMSEIKIAEGIKQPLLVVLPDAKASTGVRLLVLEDDASNFAWGSFRFINATGKPLVYACEKKMVAIPPSWNPVSADPGGERRNMEVKFYLREDSSRPISSSIWEHNPDERLLVFLVPSNDARLGSVAMKMIPENRKFVEKAAEDKAP
ncbi:MAG: hypothetical protein V4640_10645 [Verrucomicrobiota bacterium]